MKQERPPKPIASPLAMVALILAALAFLRFASC
jgi:hypothetical protein